MTDSRREKPVTFTRRRQTRNRAGAPLFFKAIEKHLPWPCPPFPDTRNQHKLQAILELLKFAGGTGSLRLAASPQPCRRQHLRRR